MFRYFQAAAFMLTVIITAAVIRPLNASNTFAAETSDLRNTRDIQIVEHVSFFINGEEKSIEVIPDKTAGQLLRTLQRGIDTALIFSGNTEQVIGDTTLEFYTWRSEIETIAEPIQYAVERHTTPSLSMGVEHIRQAGKMGEHRRNYEVIYLGSEEYIREFVGEIVIEPVSRIIDVGIGGALGTLTDTSRPSFRYARRLTMNATAYTAGFSCTGKHPDHPAYRITASGREVEHGIVAVDPRVIPLGTRLYVEGYGFSLAADTGSAIRGYAIDLFMECWDAAIQFGRRDLTVFVLE